jgi:hypothetical protein
VKGDAEQHLVEPRDRLVMTGVARPQLSHPPG